MEKESTPRKAHPPTKYRLSCFCGVSLAVTLLGKGNGTWAALFLRKFRPARGQGKSYVKTVRGCPVLDATVGLLLPVLLLAHCVCVCELLVLWCPCVGNCFCFGGGGVVVFCLPSHVLCLCLLPVLLRFVVSMCAFGCGAFVHCGFASFVLVMFFVAFLFVFFAATLFAGKLLLYFSVCSLLCSFCVELCVCVPA